MELLKVLKEAWEQARLTGERMAVLMDGEGCYEVQEWSCLQVTGLTFVALLHPDSPEPGAPTHA